MVILDESNFIKKELDAKGFSIFDFYANHLVVDMKRLSTFELKRRGELLLINTQTVLKYPELNESFKAVLNTFDGAIFFYDKEHLESIQWIEKNSPLISKMIGKYSIQMSTVDSLILANQIRFFASMIDEQKKLQAHMAKFSVELDQVLENAEKDMLKAKKIHDSLMPKRSEEIRGIQFSNKYAAGDGGGGEFFNLVSNSSKAYQILVSSQSYLISSAIMGILATQKSQDFKPDLFIKDALSEVEQINSTKRKKSETDLLVVEIDLLNLTMTCLTDSNAEFFSQNKGYFKLKRGENCQLAKGEKVVVFSPGFIFNWNIESSHNNLVEILKDNDLSMDELITELFFILKKSKEGSFLNRDATVLMLEVNRHGIHKV